MSSPTLTTFMTNSGNNNNNSNNNINSSNEDQICCKFCMEIFDEPLLLGCAHSICKKCATELFSFQQLKKNTHNHYVENLKGKREHEASNTEFTSVPISCPTCGKPTFVDKIEGVNSLKQNFDLRDAIQHLTQRRCVNECGREAIVGCLECNAVFCDECRSTVHRIPFMKTHTIISIENFEQNRIRLCPKHKIELNVFCVSCDRVACLMCYSFGEHKGHECLPIVDYAEKCKQEMAFLSEALEEKVMLCHNSIPKINFEIEMITKVRDDNCNRINEHLDRVIEGIEARRKELLTCNQSIYDMKANGLQQQVNALQVILQRAQELSNYSFINTSPHNIAHIKQKIINLLVELGDPDVVKPCYNSVLHVSIDANILVDSLKQFGKISSDADVPEKPLAPSVEFNRGKLMIEFTETFDNGSPILEYIVYGRKDNEDFSVIYSGLGNSFTLDTLVRAKYEFKVSAKNQIGESEHSNSTFYETKLTQFTYSFDFDENGLLYWIGTNGKTKDYTNPAFNGHIEVSRSSDDPSGRDDVRFAVGRETKRCLTDNCPNQWYIVNLKHVSIVPNYYSLRNWETSSHTLRNWELQGSNDGINWITLKEHVNDTRIMERKGATASWPIENINQSFQYFKIIQTGKNSSGNDYLMISGFEIYGTVFDA